MSDVGNVEFTEPLEDQANRGGEVDPPGQDLMSELPEQFQQSEVPLPAVDSGDIEPSVEDSDPVLEDTLDPEEILAIEPEAEKPQGRRDQRIQQVLQQRDEARNQQAAMQAEYQRQLYYAQQQMQQQNMQQQQMWEQQSQQQSRQLELLQAKQEREEEANLSPMEQFERKTRRTVLEEARNERAGEMAEIKQLLAQQQAGQQKAYEEQQRQARYNHYTAQAAAARNNVLLKGYDEADIAALSNETDEMILAYSAAFGLQPQEAAAKFKQYQDKMTRANLKARTKQTGQRVAQNRRMPQGAPQTRSAVASTALPSLEAVNKAGFSTHIDWMAAGEPSVS